jgi:hypothetical protein
MKAWLATTAGKVIAALALIALLAGLFALNRCSAARTAHTEVKLATGQAGAAQASGTDAVETTGNVMGNEAATDRVTKENDDAIQNAQGASAPVAAPARDAGLRSLCRRASYRRDLKCVQYVTAH